LKGIYSGEKMKDMEIKLDEEGFEEVQSEKPDEKPAEAPAPSANRPDFRVVQTDRDKEGKSVYVNVGGMWKNISKNGNEFYTLKIGQLKLLVFPNDRK
jgi:hypothetical protein